jgi:eukaryotic-like serine/threonine-protein kinase
MRDLTPTVPDDPAEAIALPESGTAIGRFMVLGVLGMGGMGVVLSAYDPHLDRKVALKLLRGDRWRGAHAEAMRAALLSEAKAMARLNHPNVVAVHEIGLLDQGGYVVMEQVGGSTLRGWLAKEERSWEAICEVMMAAGQGLAAAHRVGMVHRDFKPENVLVGEDGRPRVSDFGLAGEATSDRGTREYMAPEQLAKGAVDARADQYAFCVTLWEALHGERPGPSPASPAVKKAPGWVYAVMARGLAPTPAERWPSMDALIARLRRRAHAGRLVASGVGAIAVVSVLAFLVGREGAQAATCDGAEARLVTAWGTTRREAVHRAFAATNLSYREEAWKGVSARLDAYARSWATMYTEA